MAVRSGSGTRLRLKATGQPVLAAAASAIAGEVVCLMADGRQELRLPSELEVVDVSAHGRLVAAPDHSGMVEPRSDRLVLTCCCGRLHVRYPNEIEVGDSNHD